MAFWLLVPQLTKTNFGLPSKEGTQLDDVELLNQFIGRSHEISDYVCIFNMRDYCQQAIDLYVEAAGGKVVFRNVSTPYVNEGVLIQEDYGTEGQISHKAIRLQ